jgi:tRNA C32,U32 (ribose-2'-O)-methylase TrmJ
MNSLVDKRHRDRFSVVLVSPRNPLNIGAAARAMANFGFSRLAVVAPYEPHWREAKSAVGASDLLQNAKSTASLADAVADCTLVVGTASLDRRKPEQPVIPLPELAPFIQKELARGGRTALVFGSEKRGLSRENLALCHILTVIPTDPAQPSMNLGQAVAVCLYEIASRIAPLAGYLGAPGPGSPRTGLSPRGGDPSLLGTGEKVANPSESLEPASTRDLDLLAGVVEETMLAANYSPPAMRKANRRDLNLQLRRLSLTRSDAGRILGFFRRILWRLKQE